MRRLLSISWWTGQDAQARYGNSLESVMGVAARYTPGQPDRLQPFELVECGSAYAFGAMGMGDGHTRRSPAAITSTALYPALLERRWTKSWMRVGS